MVTGSSTAARRQLGRQLRTLREGAGKTRDDVATTRLMSRQKLEKLEFGKVSIRPGDVYELCQLYGAPTDLTERLREMALATTQDAWWQEHTGNLTRGFQNYLGLEEVAAACWVYEPEVIEGLLQTETYARAVERASTPPGLTVEEIEQLVQVRMGRQRTLFGRRRPLRLRVVLGEAALRLRVGSPEVMTEQYRQLHRMTRHDHIELWVLPFVAGPHRGLLGGFRLLDFNDPADPPVVYTQSYVWARYNDRPSHVEYHRDVLRHLESLAVPLKEFAP
jgi:transcriptional regulator with XRE-family HTH domain